jgi:hypothetical protein
VTITRDLSARVRILITFGQASASTQIIDPFKTRMLPASQRRDAADFAAPRQRNLMVSWTRRDSSRQPPDPRPAPPATHAHNVDWYPWGEAFAKARAEDKPILLSVGYATCHWCHVMERESFEDEAIARQLGAGFVAIKVDREELPDVDHVYMSALQAMTGHGGWP